jgi:hypothetical protein
MKQVSEYVWPVENYTDKIHSGLKIMFSTYKWLTFTREQMRSHLIKGYNWLSNNNDQQNALLDKLITTGIKKLIQAGIVKKVSSNVSVDAQWQFASSVGEGGCVDVTSVDAVAKTEEARKASLRRAVGGRTLHRLNNLKMGI